MDRRERHGSLEEAFIEAGISTKAELWCAMPGIIVSFNPAAMTVVVRVALTMRYRDAKGVHHTVEIPPLLDCPVVFPSAGGFALTFPVTAGDECLVVFADRCIDGWHQSGGVQAQMEYRLHDLSDGFAFIGVRSVPRVLPAYHTQNVQLRNEAGDAFIEIKPNKNVRIKTPADVEVEATNILATAATKMRIVAPLVEIVGNVTVDGTVTVTGDVVGAGVSLETHVHSGVQPGGGSSGAPV